MTFGGGGGVLPALQTKSERVWLVYRQKVMRCVGWVYMDFVEGDVQSFFLAGRADEKGTTGAILRAFTPTL